MENSFISKNYDKDFNLINENFKKLIKEKEEATYVEIERPIKKIGNSYYVHIPMDIAKQNSFENIKLKIQDKKASEILQSLMKQVEELSKDRARDLNPN